MKTRSTKYQNMKKKQNSFDVYQMVTDKISALLEEQLISSGRPWIGLGALGLLSRNGVSGNVYSGINQILITAFGPDNSKLLPDHFSIKQINEFGGHVIKGSKSIPLIYFNLYYKAANGSYVNPAWAKTQSREQLQKMQIASIPVLRYYRVFNASQTENLPDTFYTTSVEKTFEISQSVSEIIDKHDVNIINSAQDRAFYAPSTDRITMPLLEQFEDEMDYYHVLFHEMAHWTGHESRLNRQSSCNKNDESYAFEELVAELASAYISSRLGHSMKMTENAVYIKSWLTALDNDKKFFFKASSEAQKAADFFFEQPPSKQEIVQQQA
jgi:antirestriction protein ArdC